MRDVLDTLALSRARPALHAPGSHPLWTDPYLSLGMLRAHLDAEHDAASRRPGTIDASVAWLSNRLPPGARVLDLGCGPGLYTERLATGGFDVTGVDFSVRSIEHARSQGSAVRYLLGDYREIDLAERFDAVLLIYLDLGTFSPSDARRILARVRRWLAPNGVFIFDVATPGHRQGSELRRDWGVETSGFWADQPHAWLRRTLRYGELTYLDEHFVVTADEVRVYRVWERCFTEATIRAELAESGFAVRSVHGDLAGAPYAADTSTVIGVVASPTSPVQGGTSTADSDR